MKEFDREVLLAELDWSTNWPTVRDWIADMVRVEPKIMRKVAQAKFGDLGRWVENGSGNISMCGCLVGTTALELVKDRNHFEIKRGWEEFQCTRPIGNFVTPEMEAEDLLNYDVYSAGSAECVVGVLATAYHEDMEQAASDAGIAAAALRDEIGQDAAVWLIKDEIKRQLALRAKHVRGGKIRVRSAERKRDGTFAKAR